MRRFMLPLLALAMFALSADAQLLRRRPATVQQPTPKAVAPKADEGKVGGILTEGHRTIYDTARARAVGPLARKKNISRAEARELINDAADDETLHKMAAKAGLKFKAMPTGGRLTDFIQWLVDHQEQILALIKIIMALFGVDAETATEIAISVAWQCFA